MRVRVRSRSARLALDIVRERLALTGVQTHELRFDLIGVNALHGETLAAGSGEPYEVRARVTGRTCVARAGRADRQ